ncbi:cytochrome c biogenesis CcdA family protein [Raineyella sp. LH-20]|uniref:cytochrome c biogenesis CcdA family protein n=1 Tax=Raineyella sp. LH-20 TaxID=3081204 RepID=UPI002954E89D|nr:cytochrome c biogenesis protein CcdA [Raineyella sp. LH-20]WOP20215.1 cytochrome c biogenesis protein CcdA [Raineyella sp. LH-20]
MLLAVPVAVLAGLVSFFSPCCVPLLPGYLSYATGLGAADVLQDGRSHRGRMLLGSSLFVLGFGVVFVAAGVAAGSVGRVLLTHQDVISRVIGVLAILLGLVFAGVIPLGDRDLRIHRLPKAGLAAAPVLGFVFGLGWTPCIGPTLSMVLTLAMNEGSAMRGGLLAFMYVLGLGIPFVVAAVAFTRMQRVVRFVRRHQVAVLRIGGISMVLVGLLLVTGLWERLMAMMRIWAAGFGTVL